MITLTVDIENDKDLPVLKEILTRFGLNYKVNGVEVADKKTGDLYQRLQKSFTEISDWEAGKLKLQDARAAIKEIEAELNDGI